MEMDQLLRSAWFPVFRLYHRMDMNGLEHGVDREATNLLWRSQSGKAAGVLRGVIAGSIWTQDHRHRAKIRHHRRLPVLLEWCPQGPRAPLLGLRCRVDHPPAVPRSSIRSRPHLASLPRLLRYQ